MKGRILLSVAACAGLLILPLAAQNLGTEEQRKAGQALYDQYCAQCHGIRGDGEGVAAPYLKPRPRDFTQGKFKVRSTPTGVLPTDEDLKHIIRVGMPYTGMPGWPQFNDRQLTNLVYYLKTFYPGFANPPEPIQPIQIPRPPAYSQESAARGKEVYDSIGCARCHGDSGRGNGPSAPTLVDDSGLHIRAANLTKPWTFRGGSRREDIYRTLMTGFSGTPMPAFDDEGALPVEDRWPLVDFIYSLSPSREPNYASLVKAVGTGEELDLSQGVALFEQAPMARFPLVGQIMEPGRNFYPPITDVEVRAVYNPRQICILVEWDDMRAETTGENSPTLPAPPFVPEAETTAERISPPVETSPGDFWGQEDPFGQGSPASGSGDFWAEDVAPAGEPTPAAPASEFSDAVAIQLPLKLPEGIRKPYFLFGDLENPVELWFVDLARAEPQLFTARGSQTIVPGEGEPFEVRASYENGRWSVLFSRRRTSNRSISFPEGEFVPIAFSVWDGFNRERGNKRALTQWFHLYLEPLDKPSPFGPMLTRSLSVLAVLLAFVFVIRRKYSGKTHSQNIYSQEASQ